ncbi:LysR substrate-binding domain-containing protein [Neorhizobium sp. NCHU2750]|uniref:LysR family transcriptional regulator n=1 Tax=Neorhizobium sp. NCHU2750 TaxID=1825976 RepID=UPI000E71531F|nr:LysR family transcriptional regulator [Neorhizobium sp. NCHU2750]
MILDTMRMRYFTRIAQLGSLTRASGELGVAQPALSLHMRTLEEQLGTQLLNRTSRGVTLTEAGETLLSHTEPILRAIAQAEHATREQAEFPTGEVVLGILGSLSPALGIPILEECRRRFPRIQLMVSEGDSQTLKSALENRSFDLAVTLGDVAKPSATPLFEEALYVVGPPGYFDKSLETMSLSEALALPLILPSQRHGIRIILERSAAMLGLSLNIAWVIEGVESSKAAIRSGFGLSILGRGAIHADTVAGQLSSVKIAAADASRFLVLDMPTNHPPTRAVMEVRKIVVETVVALGRRGHWTAMV